MNFAKSTSTVIAAIAMVVVVDAAPVSQHIAAVSNSDEVESVLNETESSALPVPVNTSTAAVDTAAPATDNATQSTGTTYLAVHTEAPIAAKEEPGDQASDETDTAPASEDPAPTSEGEAAGDDGEAPADGTDGGAPASANDPCSAACTPKIATKASVIESYKRHRAQAAMIGDYGSCGTKSTAAGNYSWTVDWGDDNTYEHKMSTIGPYQAEHIYAKKGKYDVEVTYCHHMDDCESGCTTYSKKIAVKP